jgi:hypothetical protein
VPAVRDGLSQLTTATVYRSTNWRSVYFSRTPAGSRLFGQYVTANSAETGTFDRTNGKNEEPAPIPSIASSKFAGKNTEKLRK